MIAFDNRDNVAEAAAFRLGIHEGLSTATGHKAIAAAGKVEGGKAFYVLRYTGWPDKQDNGWQLITAPDMPEYHRLIRSMIRANYTTPPIALPVQKPGRN